MADKKQDNPDHKGLKGVQGKLVGAFGTGEGNPSVPAILGQEAKRPFRRLGAPEIAMLGALAFTGGGLTAMTGAAIGNGLYWETEPAQDTQISTTADAPYAYAATTVNGLTYLLIKDEADYRLFAKEVHDNKFTYIGHPAGVMARLEHINREFEDAVNHLRLGRSPGHIDIPEMISVSGLSIAVEEGESDIYRYFDAIMDKPRVEGLNYLDDLEQSARMWQQAQAAIQTNGYGLTAEGRAAVAERGTEDEFIANGALIGGLVPLLGMVSLMGAGVASRTRRRVKSFRERGHDDYSLR